MLKVGQAKDRKNRITWLQSTAQNLCVEQTLDLQWADQPVQETRHLLAFKDQRMSFELVFQFANQCLISYRQLRFLKSRSDLSTKAV